MSLMDVKMTTHILNVSEITKNILYLDTELIITRGNKNIKKEEHNLYLFRLTASHTALQPFLCISRDGDTQIVTAYATDNEFIIDTLKGNINEILDKLLKQTIKENKKVLKRYLELIKENI